MQTKPRPQVVHPSGSPVCASCGHTKLMHPENETPCGAARCTCKRFEWQR